MTRLIVKTGLIIFLITAVAITLIVVTILLNKESKTDAQVLNIAGKQRMLSQRSIKETYHLLNNPLRDRGHLEQTVAQFEANLADLMRGNEAEAIYLPPTTDVADALSDAQRTWGELRTMMKQLKEQQAQIALETETFLQMVPQLQEATEEVAFIVERRRMNRTMQQETRAQSGVLNLVVLMASAYLANPLEEHYEEFYNALNNYDSVLGSLANHDGFLHGSILALVSDNQLLWESFRDSVINAVEGRRTLIADQGEMAKQGEALLEALERAAVFYAHHATSNRIWLERVQYLFALLLALVVLYTLYLLWGMRDHIRSFVAHARTLRARPLQGEETAPFGAEGEQELTEAGEHINHFVRRVDRLLAHSSRLDEFSQAMSDELARLGEQIDRGLNQERMGEGCDQQQQRIRTLLLDLKAALDALEDAARNETRPEEAR